MLQAFPGFAVPGGNQNCTDDIELVLDALTYNLQYGGNNKIYGWKNLY